MKWYILGLQGGLGGPWGGKFKAQTGGEGVSVDRVARHKPKTKQEGAEEEKKGPQ